MKKRGLMRGQGRETQEKGTARTKVQSPPAAGSHLTHEDGGVSIPQKSSCLFLQGLVRAECPRVPLIPTYLSAFKQAFKIPEAAGS